MKTSTKLLYSPCFINYKSCRPTIKFDAKEANISGNPSLILVLTSLKHLKSCMVFVDKIALPRNAIKTKLQYFDIMYPITKGR